MSGTPSFCPASLFGDCAGVTKLYMSSQQNKKKTAGGQAVEVLKGTAVGQLEMKQETISHAAKFQRHSIPLSCFFGLVIVLA